MRLRFVKVAGVRLPYVTLAGMMGIVFTAAFVCFLFRFWEFFAGGMLMAVLVLIGMMCILGNRNRKQPFWVGFEAIGVPLLIVYLVGHWLLPGQLIEPWTNRVFSWIDRGMAEMPNWAFNWYRGKRSRPASCPPCRIGYDRSSWNAQRSFPRLFGTPRRLISRR